MSESASTPPAGQLADNTSPKGLWPLLRQAFAGVHFRIAALVLLVTALSWHTAVDRLGIYLAKKPVAPPAWLRIEKQRLLVDDPAMQEMTHLGPYVYVHSEKLKEDVLESLGTSQHPMNWYFMGTYRDPVSDEQFRLDVTYYTGLLDAVPHIPDVCVAAGGGRVVYEWCRSLSFAVPTCDAPWDRIDMQRTGYDKNGASLFTYYLFSMNGLPTDDYKTVRGKLTLPWVKYCFFAKIQATPLATDLSPDKGDEMVGRFLRHALPKVLALLPSAQDVEKLKQSDASGKAGAKGDGDEGSRTR
jgi:hypothetical protein